LNNGNTLDKPKSQAAAFCATAFYATAFYAALSGLVVFIRSGSQGVALG
jgi:hypothetical protein